LRPALEQPVFDLDCTLVAAADVSGIIKLWDTATGKEWLTLEGQPDLVFNLRFLDGGKGLATVGWLWNLYHWELPERKWRERRCTSAPSTKCLVLRSRR
jgi:hypothetical protein